MTTFPISILAQDAGSPSPFPMLMMFAAMFGLMYFLVIRPRSQYEKRVAAMREKLSRGDKVVTTGGIHGIITGLTPTTATIKVAEKVSVKFERTAIDRVLSESKSKDEAAAGEVEDETEGAAEKESK